MADEQTELQPQVQGESPQGADKSPWYVEHRVPIMIAVFLLVIGIVLAIVLPIVLGKSKCGDKPTSGNWQYDQCVTSGDGTLVCDDATSKWYCQCGSTDLRDFDDCTDDSDNPVAYCGSGKVAACGCGGKALDDQITWCTGTLATPICGDEDDDGNPNGGIPSCQCGDSPAPGSNDADPLIRTSNECPATNTTWSCETPDLTLTEANYPYSGVVDCLCGTDPDDKNTSFIGAFEGEYNNTGGACDSDNDNCKLGNVLSLDASDSSTWNTALKKACGCTCNCDPGTGTDKGWKCS